MIKNNQMRYACAATFGRFALPHSGHAELIQQMLDHAEYADVHLSSHDKNNSYEMRELLLRVMLRNRGIDLKRVNFYQAPKELLDDGLLAGFHLSEQFWIIIAVLLIRRHLLIIDDLIFTEPIQHAVVWFTA